jgi:tripeptidyl-peptidase-1
MSANGQNGAIIYSKDPGTCRGTSMSTPIVAAIFTRINDERLAKGKSPIGFVNPTLYANPQMFNDITLGDNSLSACSGKFFSCVQGSSCSLFTILYR